MTHSTRPWFEIIRGLGLGGAETLLQLRLAEDSGNTELVVNTAAEQDHYAQAVRAAGVRVLGVGARSPLAGIGALIRVARGSPSETVLVVHSPVPALWLKLASAVRVVRRPIIQVVHSADYKPVHTRIGKLTNRLATGAIAVSGHVAQSPSCAGFRRVRVVLGGVDIETMETFRRDSETQRESIRREHDVPESAVLACAVGTLFERKGHADLIRAMATPELENLHLLLVGDGPERDRLIALVTDMDLAERVHFAGRVPEAWRLMSGCDLLCHTSRAEGFPVVLMEAMALGLPVLATDFSGAQEAADRGGRLTIVPAGQVTAIRAALIDIVRGSRPPGDGAVDPSYWSTTRFSKEFAEAVQQLVSEAADASRRSWASARWRGADR